jgi:antirestriction protein ArdC
MRVKEHTLSNEQLHQYLATLPVPVVAWLRDTQNYVQLAAHGLTLWDVAPSRVERDLEQWQTLEGLAHPMKHYAHLQDLAALVGTEIGVSDWVTVEQARIDLFAQATGDHQWIHSTPSAPRRAPTAPPWPTAFSR